MKISLVIPVHNEEANIQCLIEKIEEGLEIEHELVVVNDHSSDKTVSIVSELSKKYKNIKLVNNEFENGFANALRTGFTSVTTGVIVPVMGDLCDDLSTIKSMLDKLDRGFDVVCGCRYIKGGARLGGSRLKGFLSFLGGTSIHIILGVPTKDIANAFKMYRKEVLDNIDITSKGFEVSMELPIKAYFLGYRITEVPTVWKERTRGASNFKVFKLLPVYLKLYGWALMKKITG